MRNNTGLAIWNYLRANGASTAGVLVRDLMLSRSVANACLTRLKNNGNVKSYSDINPLYDEYASSGVKPICLHYEAILKKPPIGMGGVSPEKRHIPNIEKPLTPNQVEIYIRRLESMGFSVKRPE